MVSNLTSGMYKFQLTVTDSIGQSDAIKVTVLVLTPEQSEREYPNFGKKPSETADRQKYHATSNFSATCGVLAAETGRVSTDLLKFSIRRCPSQEDNNSLSLVVSRALKKNAPI